MLTEEEKERYSRQLILEGFGAEAQQKLKRAKVLVIGAGGLGCPALIYLAASGIGTIGIADDDRVSISNLPRQVLYTTEDINECKVVAAKRRLHANNPDCRIDIFNERITVDNVLKILSDYDVVVDGTDNFQTKYLLNDACVILKRPLVYGSIFKFEGQVSVFNYKNGPTYRCLFSEPPTPKDMPSCNEAGVLGILPGIIGVLQATEAIKIVAGIGCVLSGKMLTFNLLDNQTEYFNMPIYEANQNIQVLKYDKVNCGNGNEVEIDMDTFNQWSKYKKIQLIDVRTQDEYKSSNLNGINIPLDNLPGEFGKIDVNSTIIVHCKTGIRARKAVELLSAEFENVNIYILSVGVLLS